jgi:hypothetical protein
MPLCFLHMARAIPTQSSKANTVSWLGIFTIDDDKIEKVGCAGLNGRQASAAEEAPDRSIFQKTP